MMFFSGLKEKKEASRTQSQACLGYAETQLFLCKNRCLWCFPCDAQYIKRRGVPSWERPSMLDRSLAMRHTLATLVGYPPVEQVPTGLC